MSFALLDTPENPAPPGGHVVTVRASDGVGLRAAWWPATTRTVRGTVCLLQGRAEFIEKYYEVVAELRERGFAVAAFDWRGQGFSERDVDNARKGHVADFALYARDLAAVQEELLDPFLPQPHFALAHSMGGAVALVAADGGRLPFERLVAVAPMVALCMVRRPRAVTWLIRVLNGLGFGRSFVPGGGETSLATRPFAGNRLTADPARYARNAAAATEIGSAAVGDPTVGWLSAAFRLMDRFEDPAVPLAIRLPTLIVAAGSDPVCATPAIERFAARLKAGHAVVIPGARHEILMERDSVRAQFWAAFDAFVPGTRDAGLAAAVEADAARGVQRGDLVQVA